MIILTSYWASLNADSVAELTKAKLRGLGDIGAGTMDCIREPRLATVLTSRQVIWEDEGSVVSLTSQPLPLRHTGVVSADSYRLKLAPPQHAEPYPEGRVLLDGPGNTPNKHTSLPSSVTSVSVRLHQECYMADGRGSRMKIQFCLDGARNIALRSKKHVYLHAAGVRMMINTLGARLTEL